MMGYVVPFLANKGGVGKSAIARSYAVEAARAGSSVILCDMDDSQRTSKRWADHRRANGIQPFIRCEMVTPRLAYDMAAQAELLVIDTPGWTDAQTLQIAKWSTCCVLPSRANRMDDLFQIVRVLQGFRAAGLEDWRSGVVLNGLRAASAQQDDADARAYLAEAGFKALPGYTRDMRAYEAALLEGKALTETNQKALNDEAFVLVNGIAGAVLEAGKRMTRDKEPEPSKQKDRGR